MTEMKASSGLQRAKHECRETLVREYVAHMRKEHVRCQSITHLADMVAKHISQQEGTGYNRAALLRNKPYRTLLQSYIADGRRK